MPISQFSFISSSILYPSPASWNGAPRAPPSNGDAGGVFMAFKRLAVKSGLVSDTRFGFCKFDCDCEVKWLNLCVSGRRELGAAHEGGSGGSGAVGAGPEDFLTTRLELRRTNLIRAQVSVKRNGCLPQRSAQTSAPHPSSQTSTLGGNTTPMLVEVIHTPNAAPRGRQQARAL